MPSPESTTPESSQAESAKAVRRRNARIREAFADPGHREGIDQLFPEDQLNAAAQRSEQLESEFTQMLEAVAERSQDPLFLDVWNAFRAREVRKAEPEEICIPDAVKLLSLDVFDTCLGRCVRHSHALFHLLGLRVQRWTGLSVGAFCEARIGAEEDAREEMRRTDAEDITFDAIYRALAGAHSWTDELRNRVAQAELDLEHEMAWVHPEGVALLEQARERGLDTIFLSDMYLDAECLQSLLSNIGLHANRGALTSGEEGVTKGSGGLFARLLEKTSVEASRIFHYGDNLHSDFVKPQAHGIRTARMPYRPDRGAWVDDPVLPAVPGDSLDVVSELSWGLARRHAASRPGVLEKIGYELVGPCALAFVHDVIRQARQRGVDCLWFLARDGYFLRTVARRLADAWNISIDTRYLLGSRRALGLASITDIDATDWDFLLKESPGMRVRDVFERVGISEETFGPRLAPNGLEAPDQVLSGQRGYFRVEDRDALYRVFVDCIECLHTSLSAERKAMCGYLEGEGFFEPQKGMLVDLGWQGSSARALGRLRRDKGLDPFAAAYLATWTQAKRLRAEGIETTGFLAEYGQPEPAVRTLERSIAALELLFSAPHASVYGMHSRNGASFPIYDPQSDETRRAQVLGPIWGSAMRFIEEALIWLPEPLEEQPGAGIVYTLRVMDRFLGFPLPPETDVFLGLQHREGWGQGRDRELLAAPDRMDSEASLVNACRTAPWRAGFLARLPADALECLLVALGEDQASEAE